MPILGRSLNSSSLSFVVDVLFKFPTFLWMNFYNVISIGISSFHLQIFRNACHEGNIFTIFDLIFCFFLSFDQLAAGFGELHQEGQELLVKSNHTKACTPHMTEHLLDSLGEAGAEKSYFHL